MSRIKRITAAALCVLTVLTGGCSGADVQPSEPLVIDYSPAAEPGKVTPPFWAVEDENTGAQVYLLGSMHAGTADASYPEYVLDAYRSSTYVAPELDTIALSGNNALLSKCAGYLRLSTGTAADYIRNHDETVEYFKQLGIYDPALESMVPFYWSSVFSSSVLGAAGLDSSCGTESQFLQMAHSGHKEIREIEGAEFQYKMMGGVPMSVQSELVAECTGDENFRKQTESTKELFEAWRSFDEDYFQGLEVYDPESAEDPDDWQTYYNMMYADRQKNMARFIENALQNGDRAFVFVGTMHFYAEPSIITLLGEAGYTVRAIRPDSAEISEAPAA